MRSSENGRVWRRVVAGVGFAASVVVVAAHPAAADPCIVAEQCGGSEYAPDSGSFVGTDGVTYYVDQSGNTFLTPEAADIEITVIGTPDPPAAAPGPLPTGPDPALVGAAPGAPAGLTQADADAIKATSDGLTAAIGNLVTLLTGYRDLVARANEKSNELAQWNQAPGPEPDVVRIALEGQLADLVAQRDAARSAVAGKVAEVRGLLGQRGQQGFADTDLNDTIREVEAYVAGSDDIPATALELVTARYTERVANENDAARRLDQLAAEAGRPIDSPEALWNALPYDAKLCLQGGTDAAVGNAALVGVTYVLAKTGGLANPVVAGTTAAAGATFFVTGCLGNWWRNR